MSIKQLSELNRVLYCRASKSAQNQLSKCMAREFARRKQNIAVVMLHPGTVDTDLSQPFQKVQTALFFPTSLYIASSHMQFWLGSGSEALPSEWQR